MILKDLNMLPGSKPNQETTSMRNIPYTCVICGKSFLHDRNHKCPPWAIERYERRIREEQERLEQEKRRSSEEERDYLDYINGD